MADEARRELLGDLKLSREEIGALERTFKVADHVQRGPIDFLRNGGEIAWTPAAALVVGAANLTFQLYTEYGKSADDRRYIQRDMQELAKQLLDIERRLDDAASVEVVAGLRDELRKLEERG